MNCKNLRFCIEQKFSSKTIQSLLTTFHGNEKNCFSHFEHYNLPIHMVEWLKCFQKIAFLV